MDHSVFQADYNGCIGWLIFLIIIKSDMSKSKKYLNINNLDFELIALLRNLYIVKNKYSYKCTALNEPSI